MQIQQIEHEDRRGMLLITPIELYKMLADAQELDNWAKRENKNMNRQIFWSSACGVLTLVLSPIPFWIKHELGPNNLLGAWSFASLLCMLIVCLFVLASSLLKKSIKADAVERLINSIQVSSNSSRITN
jgi:hypothetical protein